MPSGKPSDEPRIRQLLAQGLTAKQICLRLGVSKFVVYRIAQEQAS